jgi:hypothetical protein
MKRQTVNRFGASTPWISRFRLGFTETGNPVAFFPLATLFEERGAFETLENVALTTQSGGRAEAAML